MNNIKNQGKGELYVNGNSIKTIKFIRPAGNGMLSSQNSHSVKDPDRLEHEPQIMKEVQEVEHDGSNYNSYDEQVETTDVESKIGIEDRNE